MSSARIIVAAQDDAGTTVYQYGWGAASFDMDREVRGFGIGPPEYTTSIEWDEPPRQAYEWPGEFTRGEIEATRTEVQPAHRPALH